MLYFLARYLSYFKHRGLLHSTIEEFGLGYAPSDGHKLKLAAEKAGYNTQLMQELGLLGKSGKDFFRERVIFPFFNLSGKVIGFGGRILNDQIKTAKYLNSQESVLYNKRKTLYGLYKAKNHIRRLDSALLVEGYTDVLSLYQSGIKNTVASSGTSLTVEQVRLLKRFTNNVRVVFDGDQAGQNAALRSLEIFLEYGLNVKVVVLPDNSDPDDYIRQVGAEAFQQYLDGNSEDFIILLASNIQEQFAHDPVNKSIRIRELISSLSKISDQIKRSLYVKECAVILEVEESTLVNEVNKSIRSDIARKNKMGRTSHVVAEVPKEKPKDHSQTEARIADSTPYQEKDVIRVLIQGGHLPYDESENHSIGEYVISNVIQIAELFESELYQNIIVEYGDLLSKNIQPAQEHFLYHENDQIRNLCMELLMEPYHYANWSDRGVELQTQKPIQENYQKDSLKAILRFKLVKINQRIGEIENLIRSGQSDQLETLLMAKVKLQEERKALAEQQGTIVL